MKDVSTEILNEWLDRELDQSARALEPEARVALEERLASDPDLLAERDQWRALHAELAASHVTVRSGFRREVMTALPTAAWEPRRGTSGIMAWALPAAMIAGFALCAALLLGSSGASSPIASTGAAIFDFLTTTILAGAGLAAASWRGVGLALEELLAQSGLSLVAMGSLVLCLNLLLFSLLRRRSNASALARDEES